MCQLRAPRSNVVIHVEGQEENIIMCQLRAPRSNVVIHVEGQEKTL